MIPCRKVEAMSSGAEVAHEGGKYSGYLTVRQVADKWNVSSTTVYRLIAEGLLAAVQITERSYRVAIQEVRRYEHRHKIPTPREH